MSLKCILQGQTLQPSNVLPKSPGTAAIGSSTLYARADHVHPRDDTKLDKSGGTMTGSLVLKSDPEEDLEAATKQYVDNHTPTVTAMVYEEEEYFPTKPSVPIADGEEIPWSWEEINAITLAGKAQEYFSLGAIKFVNLSTSLLSSQRVPMIAIGFDQDGENTVTFHSKGLLNSNVSLSAKEDWANSNTTYKQLCQKFYNYCNAKDYIKTVRKGTASYNSSRNGTPIYNNETVWLPSEREMGLDTYSSLSTANSTTSKAECTQGYNAAYSYYNSDTARIKYVISDAKGTLSTNQNRYLLRSNPYNNSSYLLGLYSGQSDTFNYGTYCYFAPAFVIGNSSETASLFKRKIVQDNKDITNEVESTLSSFSIGDIKNSTRNDLGDKWALCNGDYIDSNEPIANYRPLLSTSTTIGSAEGFVNVGSNAMQLSGTRSYFNVANGYYVFFGHYYYTSNQAMWIAYKKIGDNSSLKTVQLPSESDNLVCTDIIYYNNVYYALVSNNSILYCTDAEPKAWSTKQKITLSQTNVKRLMIIRGEPHLITTTGVYRLTSLTTSGATATLVVKTPSAVSKFTMFTSVDNQFVWYVNSSPAVLASCDYYEDGTVGTVISNTKTVNSYAYRSAALEVKNIEGNYYLINCGTSYKLGPAGSAIASGFSDAIEMTTTIGTTQYWLMDFARTSFNTSIAIAGYSTSSGYFAILESDDATSDFSDINSWTVISTTSSGYHLPMASLSFDHIDKKDIFYYVYYDSSSPYTNYLATVSKYKSLPLIEGTNNTYNYIRVKE